MSDFASEYSFEPHFTQGGEDEDDSTMRHGLGAAAYDDDEEHAVDRLPFTLDFVPPTLHVEDGVSQEEIIQGLQASHADFDKMAAEYTNMPTKELRLSDLERYFDADNEAKALQILQRKHVLKIDDEYLLAHDDPGLAWKVKDIRWDCDIRVPNSRGFGAVLPNLAMPGARNMPEWSLAMRTDRRHWTYKGDRRIFGFDPAGCMLCIGNTPMQADVFITLMPTEALQQNPEPVQYTKSKTSMDSVVARITFAMLAYMMQASQYRDIYLVQDYPDVSSEDAFKAQTNILDRNIMEFSVEKLADLHDAFERHYTSWFESAPEEYRIAPFIGAEPVAVLVKYGQNRSICDPGSVDADSDMWHKMIDLSKILRMSMAYAVHFQAWPARREPIPSQDLLAEHRALYDSADRDRRVLIRGLRNWPLLDETGAEIPIYNAQGIRVLRQKTFINGNGPSCGLLQDLSKVFDLFRSSPNVNLYEPAPDEDDMDLQDADFGGGLIEEPGEPIPVTTYPQFFSKNIGQWQARGIMKPLVPPLRRLARECGTQLDGPLCIEGVSSQCYNNIAHAVRDSSRTHIAQRGPLTGASAGAWARDASTRNTAGKTLRFASTTLPHERLALQLRNGDQNSLRFENLFIFHIGRMKDEFKSGDTFYRQVLMKFREIFRSSDVSRALRSTTIVMKPEVYPRILEWTTYPITTLLKMLWRDRIQPLLCHEHGSEKPSPGYVELISVAERCLNFAHTGHAKVLNKGLMSRLWVTRGLLENGYPVFWKGLRFGGMHSTTPYVDLNAWPLARGSQNLPLLASKRSQEITYGTPHFLLYLTDFRLELASLAPSDPRDGNVSLVFSRLLAIARISLETHEEDVKVMVKQQLFDEIAGPLKDRRHEDYLWSKDRKTNWLAWRKVPFPLAYGPSALTYQTIVRFCSRKQDEVGLALPPSTRTQWSVDDFCDNIVRQAAAGGPFRAPLDPKGACGPVLCASLDHTEKAASWSDKDEMYRDLKRAMGIIVDERRWNIIPDALPNPAGNGAPGRVPSIHAWTALGAARASTTIPLNRLPTQEARVQAQLSQRSQAAVQDDARGEWDTQSLMLKHLPHYLSRVVLPTSWQYTTDSKGQNPLLVGGNGKPIPETYLWAHERMKGNLQDPLCQLALLLAILISKLMPEVHWPEKTELDLAGLSQDRPHQSVAMLRQVPWMLRNDKGKPRGHRDEALFMTQAAIVLLAWMDAESPLRVFLDNKDNKSTQWQNKHSAKRLVHINLIRLGIAHGKGEALLKSPIYKRDYWIFPKAELLRWAHEVRSTLLQKPDGPYQLCLKIVGQEATNKLTSRGHFGPELAEMLAATSSRIPSRRALSQTSSYDSDDGIDHEDSGHSRQRRRVR